MSQSFFCTQSLLDSIGDEFATVVEKYFKEDSRIAVHLVLLDPANMKEPMSLWRRTYGEIPEGKEYVRFANQKASLAFRWRMSTKELWLTRPWLLRVGDVSYFGGVYWNGFCVGVSGLPEGRDHDLAVEFIEMLMMAITSAAEEIDREHMSAHLGHAT